MTTLYLRSTVLCGQVVAEMNGTGTWTRGYVYLGSQVLAVQQQSAVNWMHEDPVTKSKRVTNSAGAVVSIIETDPWGADTARSNNAAFQPRKFTSYDRDQNGTDEAMFRRYNLWQSRFDQPDPYDGSYNLGDPQSLNRYAYVQNDPVNFVDPTGLLVASLVCFTTEHWDGQGTLTIKYDCMITGGSGGFNPGSSCGGDGGGSGGGGGGGGGGGNTGGSPQNPEPWHDPSILTGTVIGCGVNPVTGRPGFANDPRGVPGNLRPGIGGGGQFHAPRRGNPIGHQGLDVSAIPGQSPIYANRAGTITFFGPTRGLAGNLVIIDHGGGVTTRYAHLGSFADFAAEDDVNEGAEIGIAGETGNARRLPVSEAHVHFGVQMNGQNVNPATYLNSPCP